jgi:DNA mismatch repair ATPase MutS
MIHPKYSFSKRCGFGINALHKNVDMVIQSGYPVVIINQTGYYKKNVAERRITQKYIIEDQ